MVENRRRWASVSSRPTGSFQPMPTLEKTKPKNKDNDRKFQFAKKNNKDLPTNER
jgi:hypothetical protein